MLDFMHLIQIQCIVPINYYFLWLLDMQIDIWNVILLGGGD